MEVIRTKKMQEKAAKEIMDALHGDSVVVQFLTASQRKGDIDDDVIIELKPVHNYIGGVAMSSVMAIFNDYRKTYANIFLFIEADENNHGFPAPFIRIVIGKN